MPGALGVAAIRYPVALGGAVSALLHSMGSRTYSERKKNTKNSLPPPGKALLHGGFFFTESSAELTSPLDVNFPEAISMTRSQLATNFRDSGSLSHVSRSFSASPPFTLPSVFGLIESIELCAYPADWNVHVSDASGFAIH